MTEMEVKNELEAHMISLGASGPSFDTIVASGYRGALPHGVASDKVIEDGDMVTLDFERICITLQEVLLSFSIEK